MIYLLAAGRQDGGASSSGVDSWWERSPEVSSPGTMELKVLACPPLYNRPFRFLHGLWRSQPRIMSHSQLRGLTHPPGRAWKD